MNAASVIVEPFQLDSLPDGMMLFDDSATATAELKAGACVAALVNLKKNAEHLSDDTVASMRRQLKKNGMWWTAVNVKRLCRQGDFKALAAAHVIKTGLCGTIEMGTRGTLPTPFIHCDVFAHAYDQPVYTATARNPVKGDVGSVVFVHEGKVFTGNIIDAHNLFRFGKAAGRFAPAGYGLIGNFSAVPHTGGFTRIADGRRAYSQMNGKLRPMPPAKARRPFFAATNFNPND